MNVAILKSFERTGCGAVILSTDGEVLAVNNIARTILARTFTETDIATADLAVFGRTLIKQLLARGRTRIRLDSEDWVLVEQDDRRPLIMHAIPTVVQNEDGPHTVLILIDLDEAPQIHPQALERIFGLTPAEAKLAVHLSRGATTMEAASLQGISIATARSQLAAVFAKTRTTRQADLVRLLGRLAILP